MSDWQIGDWAFVYYSDDEYWYPGEIIKIDGGSYKVRYDYDDSEEWVKEDCLQGYSTYIGEKGAESWWKADEAYYAVNVIDVKDERVQVKYEDGTVEWIDLSNMRFEDVE